jgi:hypothetical protein
MDRASGGYGILTALQDSQGSVNGYVKSLRDLTEQKIAAEEREQLLEQIQKNKFHSGTNDGNTRP